MIRIFKQYIPRHFILLVLAEALICVAAMYAGKEFRFSLYKSTTFKGDLTITALLFAAVMISSMTAMGLYQRRARNDSAGTIVRVVSSFLVAVLVMSLVFYSFPDLFLGRGAFGFAVLFALIGVLIARFLFMNLAGQEALKRRILVLGTGQHAKHIADMGVDPKRYGFRVVGFLKLPGEESVLSEDKYIRQGTALSSVVASNDVDEIVVALDDRRIGLPLHEILDWKMRGVEIVDLATFFEKEAQMLKLEAMHPSWMIFSDGFNGGLLTDSAKRGFDLFASSLLLAVSWPFMLGTAIAILIESGIKAPILYRQYRVGQHGKPFQVLKFRSMRVDAEKDGVARWAQQNDDRVTRVGRVIRATRLDELPQIFNVWRGEMSFVGPRPERPEFVEELRKAIPYYEERHRVKPGITGWAQLCYPYGASVEDALRKLEYDLYYVKNHNIFLDFIILLQTAEVILWRVGSR
ncbi:MAG: TIGR03013 family PEP-CTERM/XrtA system glycosyltransferase [Chromatiales bacterium]|nr:TIGR03013 family PEP-CTERM/XrtA system glycosyltransferase [Chromatiales bacterium]